MRSSLFAIAVFTAACCAAAANAAQKSPPIAWRHTLAEGVRDAKPSQIVVVFLSTKWDPWSASIKARLENDYSNRATNAARYYLTHSTIPVIIDADSAEGKACRAKYHVHSFPSFLYLSPNGELLMKRAGYGQQFEFADRIILIEQLRPMIEESNQRLRSNPRDPLGLELAAIACAKRFMPDEAGNFLARAEREDPKNRAGKLTVAFNSLGDFYQISGKYEKAISLFARGGRVAKNTPEKAYSYLSIGYCYLSMGDHDDDVVRCADSMLSLPDLDESNHRIAEDLIRRSQAGRSRGRGAGIPIAR